VVEKCPLSQTSHQLGICHQGRPESQKKKCSRVNQSKDNQWYWSVNPGQNHVEVLEYGRVPFAYLLLQGTPACPEAMQGQHLGFLVLLHELNFTRNRRSWGLKKARRTCVLGSTVDSCRRLLLGSTVGFCWDRSSALAGIDRRLLLGSTVSCKVSSANGNCTKRFGAAERRTFSVFLIAI
jgi:hypothetical protein